ncbi:SusC/RagA family TonB-linked outer membrane protein [Bacteroides pyogenes]|uniref:SusC/RagA family TonB-linked outer membrane protein n=1 Tax=Bacteroides pyogenes TaxID=310300 RepID=UPI004064A2E8
MKRKLMLLLACLFVGIGLVTAQTLKVTGVVISEEDGQPVVGASVLVKGTSQGTITDMNGNFTLPNVPSSAKTLQVSYIGMQTQEVGIKANLKIILKSAAQQIDEVMVVAYGTAKKSSFTGSAATVKADKIEQRQVSNITGAMSGIVAGVQVTSNNSGGQPGVASKLRIRGVGSMAAGNEPLYVIDGVPFDGDLSTLNPSDIESTTVLKDAASNALYGARGANGVVLLTTKKGKIGDAVITLDAKWGTNSRAVPNYDVLKNPATYLEKAYEAIYNSVFGTSKYPTAEDAHKRANALLPTNSGGGLGYQIYTVPTGEYLIGMDGKLNPKATLGYSDGTYYYTPDDWYNELFDKGNLRQEYNVAISGASEKINYYMSAGYLDDSGLIAGSGFKRYSTRIKADYQAKKWLKIGANVAYTNYNMEYPASQDNKSGNSSANLFYIANNIAPIYPMYSRDAEGNIRKDSHGFTVYDFGDRTTGGKFKRTFMSGSNPAVMVELDKRSYKADVLSSRWYATVNLYEGLKFTYNVGLDVDNTTYRRLYNAYYGQYAQVGGIVYAGSNRTYGFNQQQLLTYLKEFGKHSFDFLIGHEAYDYKYNYLRGSKEKLFNPSIIEIDNAIKNPSINSYTNNYATEGWLSRVQYDYDGKYIFSGSYRRDASSRFLKENRWGNFGSLGGAWVVTKEDFMKNLTWIDFLKFKMSYGVQGNDALLFTDKETQNYYPYMDQYKISNNNDNFATSLEYKGNKNITWETSYSFNTGFDFTLFKEKLNGGIEYFNRKTTDLLYYMPVNPSNGYAFYPKNVGSISNSGLEFDLNYNIVKNRDINWNVYINATFIKNKINELAPELEGELIDGSRIYKEGKSMYQMYLRKYAGVSEKGEALYYIKTKDADGKEILGTTTEWNKADRFETGDLLSDVYGGFGTTINAYGFDFSISCAYQLGGKIYDGAYASFMHPGSASRAGQNWHKDILKSWSAANSKTDIPRVNASDQYTNSASDRFIISSNYLDITNITLGYTLPISLIKKVQVNSLRVYLAADNVALFSKRKGLDPRQSYTSANAYTYSPMRTISGGIKITF